MGMSGVRSGRLEASHPRRFAKSDPGQLPLDRPGAAEHASVHLPETVVGGVEHEAAGDADGDADRAAVELDCKSLGDHLTQLRASEPRARLGGVALIGPVVKWEAPRVFGEARSSERPQAQPRREATGRSGR